MSADPPIALGWHSFGTINPILTCTDRALVTASIDPRDSFGPSGDTKVTVPVRRVGERWEFYFGGDVPVREGTRGELTIDSAQITDERFKQRLLKEVLVKVLDEGAELRVALSDKETDGYRSGDWPVPRPMNLPAGTTRFVPIWLGPTRDRDSEPSLLPDSGCGGLWLKLKGMEKCELHSATVRLPEGCSVPVAISLNHAFTVLSERYEQHRISHTGNVYTRVYYKDSDHRWYPLDDLRRGVQGEAERELLVSTWQEVERKLGWRPPAPPSRRSKE